MAKKILILYNSVGLGHKSIAENIGFYLSQAGFQVKLSDILEVQKGWLVSGGTALYNLLVKWLPFFWSFLYFSQWFTGLLLPFRLSVAGKNHHNTKIVIDGFGPDMVIATHTNASAIVAFLKREKMYNGLFGIAFSDYHLHRYWLYDQANFYLANTQEQKGEMVAMGLEASKIFVCGITLLPKKEVNVQAVRQKLNIPPESKVILVGGGSAGVGVSQGFLAEFSGQPNLKVLVACGNNQKLQNQINQNFANSNIQALGYYTPMEELYAIADIFVTKPGGLSVAEALRWQLPIMVSYVLPGQEELNYEYLLSKGLVMTEPIALGGEVLEEITGHSFRASLPANQNLANIFSDPEALVAAVSSMFG